MSSLKSIIDKAVDDVTKERDEIRVKLNLAKMEAREEWEELEEKYSKLIHKSSELRKTSSEAAIEVGEAAKLLIQEIRDGFNKITEKL